MKLLLTKFLLKHKLGYITIKNAYDHIEVYKNRTLIKCFLSESELYLWVHMLRKLEVI